MKKHMLLALSGLILLGWGLAQPTEVLTFSAPFLALRAAWVNLSGALALGWMSYAILLALRPLWLERWLGGLDRLYREHKWVGIGALGFVAVHWLLEKSPRTLAAWGWVTLPPRRPHGARPPLDWWVALAREVAEPVAVVLIVLAVVALLRKIPYHWFRQSHRLLPLVFLGAAYHGVLMLPKGGLVSPFGLLVAVLAGVGGWGAALALARLIGHRRRVAATVSALSEHPNGVVDLQLQPTGAWPGHRAGQFALVTLDRREGAHPFSLTSAWQAGGGLRFAIKPLGDYTRRLARSVKVGDPVQVEGPYGGFDFAGDGPQLWVAGGIGIAPFLSRLDALAADGGARQPIVLFHAVHAESEASFPPDLRERCARAGVELIQRVSARDGRLSPAEVGRRLVPAASVWFCGSARWGERLRRSLHREHGLAAQAFHQELFEFR